MKAFSYIRVSSKGQVEGDGFDRQRKAIAKWAKANKVTIEREFSEQGISGTSELKDRPALSDLFTAILSNGVRVVVIEKADRLARDLIVSELLLRQFAKDGIQVIEAESGADLTAGDSSNPSAKLIRQILGAVAEFDKCSLVLKMRIARERIRATGARCEGRKPFGTLPGEADALLLMRALRRKPIGESKRMSYARIAKQLNAQGIPTRQGGEWGMSSVKTILTRKS
jgi:DNA invertase Pin-like site-specific DNA recombinase